MIFLYIFALFVHTLPGCILWHYPPIPYSNYIQQYFLYTQFYLWKPCTISALTIPTMQSRILHTSRQLLPQWKNLCLLCFILLGIYTSRFCAILVVKLLHHVDICVEDINFNIVTRNHPLLFIFFVAPVNCCYMYFHDSLRIYSAVPIKWWQVHLTNTVSTVLWCTITITGDWDFASWFKQLTLCSVTKQMIQ
mgnify:CR=1 FL=1